MKRLSEKRDEKKKAAQNKFKSVNGKQRENDDLVCTFRFVIVLPLIAFAGNPCE